MNKIMKHIKWQILIIMLLLPIACQTSTTKNASDIVLTRSDIDSLGIDISRIYGNYRFLNDTNAVTAYDIVGGPLVPFNTTKTPDLINKVVIFNSKEQAESAYHSDLRMQMSTRDQVNAQLQDRLSANRSFLVMNITQNIKIGDVSYIMETRAYDEQQMLVYVTLSSTFIHDNILTQLQLTTVRDIPITEFFSIIKKIEEKILS